MLISAWSFVGTDESDVLPVICPFDFIAPALHLPDEFFFATADLHRLVHIVHQTELPALALLRCPVLTGGHFLAAFLVRRQNRKPIGNAQLIADGTELLECVRILPQFVTIHEADRIDDEVGVDVVGVAVGGHLHFMSRPCFGCELSGDGMGLLMGDVLLGREGLDVLIEVDAIQLAVGIFGSQKLRDGIHSVTADTAYILVPGQPIHSLAFL